MLRGMASALDMADVPGLRNIAHLPHDERSRLAYEREQAIHLMANKIHMLKERITRKDQLLQGYDRDLGRLR